MLSWFFKRNRIVLTVRLRGMRRDLFAQEDGTTHVCGQQANLALILLIDRRGGIRVVTEVPPGRIGKTGLRVFQESQIRTGLKLPIRGFRIIF